VIDHVVPDHELGRIDGVGSRLGEADVSVEAGQEA
jgi:hypothetical protein